MFKYGFTFPPTGEGMSFEIGKVNVTANNPSGSSGSSSTSKSSGGSPHRFVMMSVAVGRAFAASERLTSIPSGYNSVFIMKGAHGKINNNSGGSGSCSSSGYADEPNSRPRVASYYERQMQQNPQEYKQTATGSHKIRQDRILKIASYMGEVETFYPIFSH